MSVDFTIGSEPIGTSTPCQLKFHEFKIYDTYNWNVNGSIHFDNTSKDFILVPTPTSSGLYHYNATTKTYSTMPFNVGPLGGAVLYNKVTGEFYTS